MFNSIFVRVFILFVCVYVSSCKKKKIKHCYYDSGELLSKIEVDSDENNHGVLKQYYKTGELFGTGSYLKGKKDGVFKLFYREGRLKALESYSGGVLIDTSKLFDKRGKILSLKYLIKDRVHQKNFNDNGSLVASGEIINKNKFGWWIYYLDGKINKKAQYLIDDNKKEFVNQYIEYNQLNDSINYENSFFYKLNIPDTIYKNELYFGSIKMKSNFKKHENYHYKVFFKPQRDIAKLDSTLGGSNIHAKLWFKFKNLGDNIFKGYIRESCIIVGDEIKKDSVDLSFVERKIYFEKKVYVKG